MLAMLLFLKRLLSSKYTRIEEKRHLFTNPKDCFLQKAPKSVIHLKKENYSSHQERGNLFLGYQHIFCPRRQYETPPTPLHQDIVDSLLLQPASQAEKLVQELGPAPWHCGDNNASPLKNPLRLSVTWWRNCIHDVPASSGARRTPSTL